MITYVFLHIPKTAGQTIHQALAELVGPKYVSPVRVHTQSTGTNFPDPEHFRLFSGHLDWLDLEALPVSRFAFSVLREPAERIASFYFYLLNKARAMDPNDLAQPGNAGLCRIRSVSADDYFFAGDSFWQSFIRDHYFNFYCYYFATRRVRGYSLMSSKSLLDIYKMALRNIKDLDRIYDSLNLLPLEQDIQRLSGKHIGFARTYRNVGPLPLNQSRWRPFLDLFERDVSVQQIQRFVEYDSRFYERVMAAERLPESLDSDSEY